MIEISWELFGEELKELRKAYAIEVKPLADKVGCDSNQIINMEQKKEIPSLYCLNKISKIQELRNIGKYKRLYLSEKPKKILVFGIGYVGLSVGVLLSKFNYVVMTDVKREKVDMINSGLSPIKDTYIEDSLKTNTAKIRAIYDVEEYSGYDYIIIATPTNYSDVSQSLETKSVDSIVDKISVSYTKAIIVIKSTLPIGHTSFLSNKYPYLKFIYSPEFLRESEIRIDSLYPSRIIVSNDQSENFALSAQFAVLLSVATERMDARIFIFSTKEAEAVKLFSNAYLAMRVAYVNELDSYAESMGLDSRSILEGMCTDVRIGNYYNNPSFGYGGYCLPKDSKQLLNEFKVIPHSLINAIVSSNEVRKEYVLSKIMDSIYKIKQLKGKEIIVGVYRLVMKINSDDFRDSAIGRIIEELKKRKIQLVVYEPLLEETTSTENYLIIGDIEKFKKNVIW